MDIAALNEQFAISGQLEVISGQGGFPVLSITNQHASSQISLYGGQVLSYQPTSAEHDLLYVSPNAYYEAGKATKGGIPVCWPWFGKDPDDKGRAAHGFVRNRLWELTTARALPDGGTAVTMTLYDTPETQAIWAYSFRLRLKVVIGENLTLALQTINHDVKPFTLTQALHTYFAVGDVEAVQLQGLDAVSYLDTTEADWSEKKQAGAVTVGEEVDRIYQQSPSELCLQDVAWQREVMIRSMGSTSTVVWNPWETLSVQSGDLPDDAYKNFICVETTNAAADSVLLEPEQSHTLAVVYSVADA